MADPKMQMFSPGNLHDTALILAKTNNCESRIADQVLINSPEEDQHEYTEGESSARYSPKFLGSRLNFTWTAFQNLEHHSSLLGGKKLSLARRLTRDFNLDALYLFAQHNTIKMRDFHRYRARSIDLWRETNLRMSPPLLPQRR